MISSGTGRNKNKFGRSPFKLCCIVSSTQKNTMETKNWKENIVINGQTLSHTLCFRQKWILITPWQKQVSTSTPVTASEVV